MYRSLKIEGFRRFRRLELQELARVNLLVGRNNSGKTSVLEALSMLANPESLVNLALLRGELSQGGETPSSASRLLQQQVDELDVACFLHAYAAGNGGFSVSAAGELVHRLRGRIEGPPMPLLTLQLEGQDEVSLELSERLGLPLWQPGISRKMGFPQRPAEDEVPSVLMTAGGHSAAQLASYLGAILLTPEEDLVLEALRLIEPSILRIALLGEGYRSRSNSQKLGVFVLCEGRRRVPLGNLGDGVWRLLMIVLSLVNAARGILLIDEIDTGLHHSVLEGMWRLVLKTASRLEVQVFATTHSDDCWKALARVLEAEAGSLDEEVSLQRLEADKEKAVIFPGNRIRIAAANDIEVR